MTITYPEKYELGYSQYIGKCNFQLQPDGWGVMQFTDGRKYEGEFKNDAADGYDVIYSLDGTKQKEGLWEDGKLRPAPQVENPTQHFGNIGRV